MSIGAFVEELFDHLLSAGIPREQASLGQPSAKPPVFCAAESKGLTVGLHSVLNAIYLQERFRIHSLSAAAPALRLQERIDRVLLTH